MDLIKLSWYLVHVEHMERNSDIKNPGMIEDTLENLHVI